MKYIQFSLQRISLMNVKIFTRTNNHTTAFRVLFLELLPVKNHCDPDKAHPDDAKKVCCYHYKYICLCPIIKLGQNICDKVKIFGNFINGFNGIKDQGRHGKSSIFPVNSYDEKAEADDF